MRSAGVEANLRGMPWYADFMCSDATFNHRMCIHAPTYETRVHPIGYIFCNSQYICSTYRVYYMQHISGTLYAAHMMIIMATVHLDWDNYDCTVHNESYHTCLVRGCACWITPKNSANQTSPRSSPGRHHAGMHIYVVGRVESAACRPSLAHSGEKNLTPSICIIMQYICSAHTYY